MRPYARLVLIFFFSFGLCTITQPSEEDMHKAFMKLVNGPTIIHTDDIPQCGQHNYAPCIDNNGNYIHSFGHSLATKGKTQLRKRGYWWDLLGKSLACSAGAITAWEYAISTCITQYAAGRPIYKRPCSTTAIAAILVTGAAGAAIRDSVATIRRSKRSLENYMYHFEKGNITLILGSSEVASYKRDEASDVELALTAHVTIDGMAHGESEVTVRNGTVVVEYRPYKFDYFNSQTDNDKKKQMEYYETKFQSNMGLEYNYCHLSDSHSLGMNNDWNDMWAMVNNDLQYINRCYGYDLGVVDLNDRPNGWPVLMSTGYLILESQGFGDNFETCHRNTFGSVTHDDHGDEL